MTRNAHGVLLAILQRQVDLQRRRERQHRTNRSSFGTSSTLAPRITTPSGSRTSTPAATVIVNSASLG